MRLRSRLILGAVLALTVGVATATADPINPPNHGLVVTVHCDQLGTFDVIGEGNGRWDRTAEPMHALDSTLVLVAYSFHFELTRPGGATVVLVDYSKPAPKNGHLDVCEFTDISPEGTFHATFGISYTGG